MKVQSGERKIHTPMRNPVTYTPGLPIRIIGQKWVSGNTGCLEALRPGVEGLGSSPRFGPWPFVLNLVLDQNFILTSAERCCSSKPVTMT
jgi:hypothetical protein